MSENDGLALRFSDFDLPGGEIRNVCRHALLKSGPVESGGPTVSNNPTDVRVQRQGTSEVYRLYKMGPSRLP